MIYIYIMVFLYFWFESDICNVKIFSYIFILSLVNCKNMLMFFDYLWIEKNCFGLVKFVE